MADTLSNKILLKDRQGNPLLPITNADAVQYNRVSGNEEGRETVKTALDNINSYIGTVTNITSYIAEKIGYLDSDTLVNIAADEQGNKTVPEGRYLTYVQIADGKIVQADYTAVTAANVTYNVSNDETSDLQTVVTELYDDIAYAAEEARKAAEDAAKAKGVTQVSAYAPIIVTSISSEDDDDAGKVQLALDYDSTLTVTSGQLGVNVIEKSQVSGLESTLNTYWAEIAKLESQDRTTVGSVRQIAYDYTDSKVATEQSARETADSNIISYMGLENGASYWSADNTIKGTTDALVAAIESSALTVDNATILSNNNVISTGLKISLLKDAVVGDVTYAHAIALDDNNNNHVSIIDAAEFVKDGMISNVELSGTNLIFTWNTDSTDDGTQKTTTIPLSAFVQDYAAGAGLEKSGTNPSYTVNVKAGNGIGATVDGGTYINLSSEGDTTTYLSFDNTHALKLDGITTALSNAVSTAVSSIGVTSNYQANDNKVVTNATISNGMITLQREQLTAAQVSYSGIHEGQIVATTVNGEIAYIHDEIVSVAESIPTVATGEIQKLSSSVDASSNDISKVSAKSHVLTKVSQAQGTLATSTSESTDVKDLVLTGITYTDTSSQTQEQDKTVAQVSSYLISQGEALNTTVDQLARTIVSSKGFTYVAVDTTDNTWTGGAYIGVNQTVNTELSYTTYTLQLHDVASNAELVALNDELSAGTGNNNHEGAVFYTKLYNGTQVKTSRIDESIF